MRRTIAPLLLLTLVLACQGDGPTEPTQEVEAFDLVAALRGPPDLSGLLPELERRVFIHYRRGAVRPDNPGDGNGNGNGKEDPPEEEPSTSTCFSFLANGAGWNAEEPYVSTFPINNPVDTWNYEAAIFGGEEALEAGEEFPAFTGELDEVNSAQFGAYPNATNPDPKVIAVTVVWGVFRGPPSQRRLVEWDILMNGHLVNGSGGSFTFGDVNHNPDRIMDTENIVAHELGHAAGLGHAPSDCTEETMFGSADFRETNKRDLETGDIQGIVELY